MLYRIPIFYNERMSATLSNESTSPSSRKPRLQVAHWQRHHAEKIEIRDFDPITREQLCIVHSRDYVNGVLDCEAPNGFMTFDPAVASSLPYTSGSMLAAARLALEQQSYACSPTSGFHHAGQNYGGGFCTFNGLALAAVVLAKEGAKVGILDSDAHFGNGTTNILSHHQHLRIKHWTWGLNFHCGREVSNTEVFEWHQRAVDDLADCDVVLYQAGADPHIDDPLGGMISEEAFAIREAVVFGNLSAVAWNLAGGYRKAADGSIDKVLLTHDWALRAAFDKKNGIERFGDSPGN